jgi:hypothetical protein
MKRTITITFEDGGGWVVHEDDKHSGQLSWDEMLGQVAMPTIRPESVGKGFGMRTREEWVEYNAKLFPAQPKQAVPPLQLCAPNTAQDHKSN